MECFEITIIRQGQCLLWLDLSSAIHALSNLSLFLYFLYFTFTFLLRVTVTETLTSNSFARHESPLILCYYHICAFQWLLIGALPILTFS